MLAVCDIAHALPVRAVVRVFLSMRMRPENISHTSLVIKEKFLHKNEKNKTV